MVASISYIECETLPENGTVHAIIKCRDCMHEKSFSSPITGIQLDALKYNVVCSQCEKKNKISIYIYSQRASRIKQQTKFSNQKNCIVCGVEISESTLFALPHTKCCSEHLSSNPTVTPKIEEPLGTREDFKKDSTSNWVNSRKNKL